MIVMKRMDATKDGGFFKYFAKMKFVRFFFSAIYSKRGISYLKSKGKSWVPISKRNMIEFLLKKEIGK